MATDFLLKDVDVDTDGDSVRADGANKTLSIFVRAGGSFGGGTVTLQVSPNNVDWITVRKTDGSLATYTGPEVVVIDRVAVGYFRATLTGSAGASLLNVQIAS